MGEKNDLICYIKQTGGWELAPVTQDHVPGSGLPDRGIPGKKYGLGLPGWNFQALCGNSLVLPEPKGGTDHDSYRQAPPVRTIAPCYWALWDY